MEKRWGLVEEQAALIEREYERLLGKKRAKDLPWTLREALNDPKGYQQGRNAHRDIGKPEKGARVAANVAAGNLIDNTIKSLFTVASQAEILESEACERYVSSKVSTSTNESSFVGKHT